MDAFGSLFSIPFQLTTIEAVQQIDRALKDDGVVIFNLVSAIEGDSSRFLQAEIKTYQQVFPQVFLFKINSHYPDDRVQNLIIVASKKNFASLISNEAQMIELLNHLYGRKFESEINILTDDLAPVEYYNSFGQSVYRTIN
jgi:spermidine synthase